MIDPKTVAEIVAVYRKHGWILRRILLSNELKSRLTLDEEGIYDGVHLTDSDIDAAWFSRPPQPGGVAWEIRHLSIAPYALVERVDEFSEGFEGALVEVETRFRAAIASTNLLTNSS